MQHEPRKCVEPLAQVGGQVASLRHEDDNALIAPKLYRCSRPQTYLAPQTDLRGRPKRSRVPIEIQVALIGSIERLQSDGFGTFALPVS
jgi:hypothetical protein